MNEQQARIMECLSASLGWGGSILELTRRIQKRHGSGYYSNIYNATKGLEKQGLVKMEKQGKSSIIRMDFDNPDSLYRLSEIDDRNAGLDIQNEIRTGLLDMGLEQGIAAICALETAYHAKINRIELLFLAQKHNTADLIAGLRGLESQYNMRIDPIIITIDEFAQMMKSDERSRMNDMMLDRKIIYNSEGFWRIIAGRGISGGYETLGRPLQELNQNELSFNYNRYGYSLYEKRADARKICLEDTIFAMSMSREARIRYGGPILVHKNMASIHWGYLYYLYKRHDELGRLHGMLISLPASDTKGGAILPYINAIKDSESTNYDKGITARYLQQYG
jgi:hypothetical protein